MQYDVKKNIENYNSIIQIHVENKIYFIYYIFIILYKYMLNIINCIIDFYGDILILSIFLSFYYILI